MKGASEIMKLEDSLRQDNYKPRCDYCGSTDLLKKNRNITLCISCGERNGD